MSPKQGEGRAWCAQPLVQRVQSQRGGGSLANPSECSALPEPNISCVRQRMEQAEMKVKG